MTQKVKNRSQTKPQSELDLFVKLKTVLDMSVTLPESLVKIEPKMTDS